MNIRANCQCSEPSVVHVCVDDTVAKAADRMLDSGVGCVVVTDDAGILVGILTERDVLPLVKSGARSPCDIAVSEVMSGNVICCRSGTSMRQAQKLMTEHRIRHLAVTEDGRPEGVISARDVMEYQRRAELGMRQAAEDVARTFTSLRSVDFDEVVELIVRDAPRLLGARRSVLVCPDSSVSEGYRAYRNNCTCPEDQLRPCMDTNRLTFDQAPPICRSKEAGRDTRVIALRLPRRDQDSGETVIDYSAYLCLCGFDCKSGDDSELVDYKIALIREGLSANLVNAKLFQEYAAARNMVFTDGGTGVGTRRLFEEELMKACAQARRYGRPFCLAMIDVDHFKAINDTFGHAVGDMALARLAQCMKQGLRETDILARYGGDEFVVLMPENTRAQSLACMERICGLVNGLSVPEMPALSISAGVVQQDVGGMGVESEELIRRADAALYRAKRAGRNRVEFWENAVGADLSGEGDEALMLRGRVATLMSQSRELFMESIRGLVRSLDARDHYTREHSENVSALAAMIAQRMGLDAERISIIRRAGLLHDLGMIGVPDTVLRKTDPLNEQEWAIIRRHPVAAVLILEQMSLLRAELPVIRQHHERWDGTGYPDGLDEQAICVEARVLAVADVFEALASPRNYRAAICVKDALEEIRRGAGTHFDPDCVIAFANWAEDILREKEDQGISPGIRDFVQCAKAAIDQPYQPGPDVPAASQTPAAQTLATEAPAAPQSADAQTPAADASAGQVAEALTPQAAAPQQTADTTDGPGEISRRERDVLRLVADGLSSPQIARKLHVSTRTVEAHRRNMMTKLNRHSIAELTKYALQKGLTSL